MTTAHRPTFNPARGGTGRNEGDLSKLSNQYSSRDMPSHKTLKYRQKGQAHPDEVRAKDLRRELEEREQEGSSKDRDRRRESRDSESASLTPAAKKPKVDAPPTAALDADDPLDELDTDEDDDDSDDDAELMAELERIKKERAAERAIKEEREREEQERIRAENILHGNPLLAPEPDFKVKRRWDDDVVFKNCAKGVDERKKEQHFINDAIRSEFHKRFMEKYIK
ncbi:CWC15 protein [Aphelenchoides avenae]|nr:CWC15 protein [Aphelenchus avenae]